MRCLDFGDLDELSAKYGNDLVNEMPILPSASQTTPTLLIKARDCALEADYIEKTI
jgi:anaerobic dimethyl sulfoxide reductase subunit B (iron-sulfur subunit)